MGYSATVVADSVYQYHRLTTMVVTFPRIILAELNTHRVFSRNSASSRAVPSAKLIDQVRTAPFVPESFGSNRRGMVAGHEVEDPTYARDRWLRAAQDAAHHAEELERLGVHKQLVNRVLEPYLWHTAIVSATDWNNFFDLRLARDAQPQMQLLAQCMAYALDHSTPIGKGFLHWHYPWNNHMRTWDEQLARQTVSRCARVSYDKHEVPGTDIYDTLATSRHWSPFEHVARAGVPLEGNFRGWTQLRHLVENKAELPDGVYEP